MSGAFLVRFVQRIVLGGLIGSVVISPGGAQEATLAIRAKTLHTGAGDPIENGVLLVRHGSIIAVGSNLSVPSGVKTLEREVVAPGFVDLQTRLGATAHVAESAEPNLATLRVAPAIELEHRDFRLAARSGITTAAVLPWNLALVSGRAAVVKIGSKRARVISETGPLVFSIGQMALSTRYTGPSTHAGLVARLRDELGAVRNKPSDPLKGFVQGRELGFFVCPDANHFLSLLPLVEEYGLKIAAVNLGQKSPGSDRFVEDLVRAQIPAIFAPLSFRSKRRELEVPGRLAKAGVLVALTSSAPKESPHALRLSAVLAAQHGMSLRDALRAITAAPAELLGLGRRIGSLSPGKDADFVVWSRDPLDMSSQLLETYVEGELVFKAGDRRVRGLGKVLRSAE